MKIHWLILVMFFEYFIRSFLIVFVFLMILIFSLIGCGGRCEDCKEITTSMNKGDTSYPKIKEYEACGDQLKEVDGKVFYDISGSFMLTTKIECK